ncbi:MAG: MTH1187 family thiamine-binding protein [Spirochaetota bacterium]|nr:MTH1187 family thiamine-binding protein [Spirochaetota bacterium]
MSNHRNVLLEFSISPLDKGVSLSPYVARSLEIIDKSGLEYKLNPMGTVLEGSWDEVIKVVTDCFNRMKEDCDRITAYIKVDYRKEKTNRLKTKIQAVEKHLGKELKK